MSIPISVGTGVASVAAEAVSGLQYQQIEVYGGGGSSILGINPDRSINASIIGTPSFSLSSSSSSVIAVLQTSSLIARVTGSIVSIPSGNQSVSGSLNITGTPSISGTVIVASILSTPAIVSTANSTTSNLNADAVFTGTSEQVKDFGSITVSIFSNQASATDGLSLQQSSNGTNWDIVDTYTIPASTGKTFSIQPAAQFFRLVYTNGSGGTANQLRIQTVYHTITTKASSQRPSDGYTNETDLEQVQGFGMMFNETTGTWFRQRGNSSIGALVYTTSSIVAAGTYAEDSAHTPADRGLFALGVRNDTVASVTSADGDYSQMAVGPSGESITANAPFTRWIRGTADLRVVQGASVTAIAAQGASVFTYITGIQLSNMGSASVLVTFTGGLGSILGYSIAPAGGGSNILYPNALKTGENSAFAASISGTASVLVSAQGFTARI